MNLSHPWLYDNMIHHGWLLKKKIDITIVRIVTYNILNIITWQVRLISINLKNK